MRFVASIFRSVGEPPRPGSYWSEFNCETPESILELRISAIVIGDIAYLVVGDNCHPEVVASATSVVNRYPSIHVTNAHRQYAQLPTQLGTNRYQRSKCPYEHLEK